VVNVVVLDPVVVRMLRQDADPGGEHRAEVVQVVVRDHVLARSQRRRRAGRAAAEPDTAGRKM